MYLLLLFFFSFCLSHLWCFDTCLVIFVVRKLSWSSTDDYLRTIHTNIQCYGGKVSSHCLLHIPNM